MLAHPGLVLGCDLVVAADHGQIYISSAAMDDWTEDDNPYLDALADATDSGRFVGVIPGLIDLMTPGQSNFETPMRLEVWTAEPADDTEGWDHEVDVDLDVPDGSLYLEASGGGPGISTEVPPGRYRVRVSGKGFTEIGHAGAEGGDSSSADRDRGGLPAAGGVRAPRPGSVTGRRRRGQAS